MPVSNPNCARAPLPVTNSPAKDAAKPKAAKRPSYRPRSNRGREEERKREREEKKIKPVMYIKK